jgi:hypothetical protein
MWGEAAKDNVLPVNWRERQVIRPKGMAWGGHRLEYSEMREEFGGLPLAFVCGPLTLHKFLGGA